MFKRKCAVIGVVHVLPLPGSAGYGGHMDKIIRAALTDADVYQQNGVDALIVENMHDVPYLKGYVEPETTAAVSVVAQLVKQQTGLPVGVQILAGANKEALGTAVAAALDFMRVEGFVFAHVGDEGIHQASAPELIRRRAQLRAQGIKIYADIKKKHSSHAITSDVSLEHTAQAAEFFCADGVIVTGHATGVSPLLEDVRCVKQAVSIPVLVGSGMRADNVCQYLPWCNAVIVGSDCKYEGHWKNQVDPKRVSAFCQAVDSHD